MSAMVQNLISQLDLLSADEREAVRNHLSIPLWEPGVREAWIEEAERRQGEMLDGTATGIPGDVHLARLAAKYGW